MEKILTIIPERISVEEVNAQADLVNSLGAILGRRMHEPPKHVTLAEIMVRAEMCQTYAGEAEALEAMVKKSEVRA